MHQPTPEERIIPLNHLRPAFGSRPAIHVKTTDVTAYAQFTAVRRHLPSDLRGLATVAFITGWRVPSELQILKWRDVDLKVGLMRLEPGIAKNKEGRPFPFTPALRTTLETQRALTDQWQRVRGRIIPYVFHRKGKPIKDWRAAWHNACRAAGVIRIPHDFRRTTCAT